MTMTDAELAEIRARVERIDKDRFNGKYIVAGGINVNDDVGNLLHAVTDLCDEVEVLLDELARAREVIVAYAHADPSLYGDVCDCDGGDCAREYLRDTGREEGE